MHRTARSALSSIIDATWLVERLRGRQPRLERIRRMIDRIIAGKSDAEGLALATAFFDLYDRLDMDERKRLFTLLTEEYGPDRDRLLVAARRYVADPTATNAGIVTEQAEPARQALFRKLNCIPDGTARIIEMRRTLLSLLPSAPGLAPLAHDLRHLLASWFNRGFLQMRRIDWTSPAALLEKLIAYEAVHPIDGWSALKRRLRGDRRCFGFFHPSLPSEPLIFVEVALTSELSGAIAPLIGEPGHTDQRPPTAAIFYSISNCQPGLRSITFGNFLIKQVVADLKAEFPTLSLFSTLSPIPGFRTWTESSGALARLTSAERATLDHADWWQDETAVRQLRPVLMRLCADYLLDADAYAQGRGDPVGRFHLGNGARIERICWAGDLSGRGIAQSFGMMVNYRYITEQIERNADDFVNHHMVARKKQI